MGRGEPRRLIPRTIVTHNKKEGEKLEVVRKRDEEVVLVEAIAGRPPTVQARLGIKSWGETPTEGPLKWVVN